MSPMVTVQNFLAPGQNGMRKISGWASGMPRGPCSMKMGPSSMRGFDARICFMGKVRNIMTMGMFS
jgi:hypothetical protein